MHSGRNHLLHVTHEETLETLEGQIIYLMSLNQPEANSETSIAHSLPHPLKAQPQITLMFLMQP